MIQTREPGGTPLGETIRGLILKVGADEAPMAPKTELFLYLASRAQHVAEVILPALNKGQIVLCDRFSDATLAYQGDGRGLPKEMITEMTRFASSGLEPDLTFFLNLDVKSGLARLKGRDEINRMDQETLDFHEAVNEGYHGLVKADPKRFAVIDASDPIQAIALKIQERVDAVLR